MKIKVISWMFLGLLAVIMAVSCATAPAAEPPPPAQQAAPASPPAQPPVSPPPAPPPSAPQGLDALSADALARLYSDTENELNAARAAAVASGADIYAPDFLLDADNTVASALQKYEANDRNGAKAAADEALVMYNALKNGLDAYAMREEFAWRVEELLPEALWQADDVALEMFDKWRAKDYSGAKDGADKALLVYGTIKTGLEAYDARQAAERRLNTLAPDFLSQADEIALAALDKWEGEDYNGAKDGADKALFMYDTLKAGLAAYDTRESIALDALAIEPEALWQADNIAFEALDKWENEDYDGARAGVDRAQFVYDTLKLGLEAYQLREDIALEAVKSDPNALWRMDDVGWQAIDKWYAEDYEGARADAETAMFGYTVTGAAVERQRALDARADIAVRQEFNAAQDLYTRANAALQGQRNDEAARLYRESLAMFRLVTKTALDRRASAEDALRRAEQRVTESDQTARNADAILEGGR